MILYHGSTMEVSQPHILKSEIGRDFGFAFYTTDIQPQAERWARRRAMIESRRTKKEVLPIVSVYEWDEDAAKQLRNAALHMQKACDRARGKACEKGQENGGQRRHAEPQH